MGDQTTRSPGNPAERLPAIEEAPVVDGTQEERRQREAYADGWHACQEEMINVLVHLGVITRDLVEEAYDHCADYYMKLYEWCAGDCSSPQPRPTLPAFTSRPRTRGDVV